MSECPVGLLGEQPVRLAMHNYRMIVSCRNQPGIVAAVSKFVADHGGDIVDARQFDDRLSGRFFMRLEFMAEFPPAKLNTWRANFMPIVERFGFTWTLREANYRKRVLLMVSKFDHCLEDLLYRTRIGELPMEVTAVVSNHPRSTFGRMDIADNDFHYIQVTPDNKIEQERRLLDLVSRTGTEMVVLARYMQVLSDDLARNLYGRCINVHHSFLPGFKGA